MYRPTTFEKLIKTVTDRIIAEKKNLKKFNNNCILIIRSLLQRTSKRKLELEIQWNRSNNKNNKGNEF